MKTVLITATAAALVVTGCTIETPTTETAAAAETKTVVPQECLDALDDADQIGSLTADFAGATVKALRASANFDAAGIRAATRTYASVNRRLDPVVDSYISNRDACQDAAKNNA